MRLLLCQVNLWNTGPGEHDCLMKLQLIYFTNDDKGTATRSLFNSFPVSCLYLTIFRGLFFSLLCLMYKSLKHKNPPNSSDELVLWLHTAGDLAMNQF